MDHGSIRRRGREALWGLSARWLRELGAFVYPARCWLCDGAAYRSAEDARTNPREPNATRWLGGCELHRVQLGFADARCRRCVAPLGEGLADGGLCYACRRSSPRYARVFALAPYRAGGGLATWILALKYGGRRDVALPLGGMLATALPNPLGGGARGLFVAAVPLHRRRRLERGYDQSELLAREVGRALDLPFGRVLVRTRWTAPQGSSFGSSRTSNVAGAFRLKRRAARDIDRRDVILVDDVCTSGATLSACAGELRRGGVRTVYGLVLARAGSG